MIRTNDPNSWPNELVSLLDDFAEALTNWAQQELAFNDGSIDPDSLKAILRSNCWQAEKDEVAGKRLPDLLAHNAVTLLHYSRLLEYEIADILREGLAPTSENFLDQRLSKAVSHGQLSESDKERLINASCLANPNQGGRIGEVCFVSVPQLHSDNGVFPLLSCWGGEMTHFGLGNGEAKSKLKNIGKPVVIEASIQLTDSKDIYLVSNALINSRLSQKMSWAEPPCCELHIKRPILPSELVNVHQEGSVTFAKLSEGRWP